MFFFRPEGYNNKPISWQLFSSIWDEVLLFLDPFGSQIFDAFLSLFGYVVYFLILENEFVHILNNFFYLKYILQYYFLKDN